MKAVVHAPLASRPLSARRVGTLAIGLFTAAQMARTLTDAGIQGREVVYGGLLAAFLVLLGLVIWRPNQRPAVIHAYLAVQSLIVLALVVLNARMDYVTALLIPVAYQASLYFRGRALQAWTAGLAVLSSVPLMVFLGPLPGLALSLVTVAGVIMIPAYVVLSHEIELAHQHSQALLNELQATNHSLQEYTAQAEELAVIEERNRVARELHDTVSQIIFSIALTSRAAQILLHKNPARVEEQLARLQELTAAALGELRSLITQMRASEEED